MILDPAIGLLEMLLPASRAHRIQRLAQTKAEKELRQKHREHLLAQVMANEDSERLYWREQLKPQAERLAGLLAHDGADLKQAEREAVSIGVSAWQTGGLSCMREVRDMAIALCKQMSRDKVVVDYVSFWWDGIGNWRATPLSSSR